MRSWSLACVRYLQRRVGYLFVCKEKVDSRAASAPFENSGISHFTKPSKTNPVRFSRQARPSTQGLRVVAARHVPP